MWMYGVHMCMRMAWLIKKHRSCSFHSVQLWAKNRVRTKIAQDEKLNPSAVSGRFIVVWWSSVNCKAGGVVVYGITVNHIHGRS